MVADPLDSTRTGFTLIELSIVLVIIGLIVGGVLAGQDLIKAAELRSIIRELEQFNTSVMTFQTKYDALPGDMRDAESIWGSDVSCPNTPTNSTPKQATCNGNGDGRIGYYGDDFDFTQSPEMFRFWQQLGNADLVAGRYSGVTGPTDPNFDAEVGINVPESHGRARAGYTLLFFHTVNTLDNFIAYNSHLYQFGYDTQWQTYAPVFTPGEMLNFDQKIDDGRPGTGLVTSHPPHWALESNCATSNNAAVATYNAAFPGVACGVVVIAPF